MTSPAKQAHAAAPFEPVERYEGTILGECDMCGVFCELTRCFAPFDMETFACEECRS